MEVKFHDLCLSQPGAGWLRDHALKFTVPGEAASAVSTASVSIWQPAWVALDWERAGVGRATVLNMRCGALCVFRCCVCGCQSPVGGTYPEDAETSLSCLPCLPSNSRHVVRFQ